MKILHPELFNKTPNAILFDMDDTLYPYKVSHDAALAAVKEKVVKSLSISPDNFDKAFQEGRNQIHERLKDTASSHSRLLYFQRMLEIMGLGSQVLLALDYEQCYWQTFLKNATLFEGVNELLDDIRLYDIPTAIVTDLTAQIQFRKIIYFGLDHYFDYIVTSEESGFDKPHQASYQLAIKKICPKGSCIWMIGDNPLKDINGSRETLNAVAIQKVHFGVSVGSGKTVPDATFTDYHDLRKLLSKIVDKNG